MGIKNLVKLKEVTEENADFLYEMLKERDSTINVTHKELPSFNKHLEFIKSNPYDAWYIIEIESKQVGHIWLDNVDRIGWFTKKEFKGFGFPVSHRLSLMNEGIEVLQRCFKGEKFSYKGKRYNFEDVKITPGYIHEGGPPLWIAAMSEPGALRAAKYDTNFLPQGLRKKSFDPWVEALQESDRNPSDYRVGIIRSILVTNNKESDWEPIRQSERYRMELYKRFFEESGEGFGDPGEPIPQTWIVGTVEECVEELKKFILEFGITDIVTMAAPPGIRLKEMSASLELLFREVVPRLKKEIS